MTFIDVAVAVCVNNKGDVLLTQRPDGKVYAQYWEFPGGKVEKDETVLSALIRECQEELGIVLDLNAVQPWCCCEYVYPHAHVRLHFYICHHWLGDPIGLEGQAIIWQKSPIQVAPILPATVPLLDSLFAFLLNHSTATFSKEV